MTNKKNNNQMKVYISLPITGKDLQEQKRHAEAVASFLLTAGFTPVNPFNNGLGDGAPYWEHIREDLKLLLGCGAIWLCKGWEASTGCVLERNVAAACGMASVTEAMPIGKAFDILKAREHEQGNKI